MRCIVVDDDPSMLSLVGALLSRHGHDVDLAESLHELEHDPSRLDVDLVVLDYRLGRSTGMDVIRLLVTSSIQSHVILLSGAEREQVLGAVDLGRVYGLNMLGVLGKPLDGAALLRIVDQLQASLRAISSEHIRDALQHGHFMLAYQPKFCLSTGRVKGVEALARWQDPELGLVPPDRFISVAEKDGQITPLTWLLVDQALAQQCRWQRSGIRVDMAINLSPVLLDSEDFVARFLERLTVHEVSPESLTLELTETRGLSDMERAIDQLSHLCDLGFDIAIDDFGTGNASMLQLYRLPFTQLKIDRAFVTDCHGDSKAESIVEMIIQLAHRLEIEVVAEGVETLEQGHLLKRLGCHSGQGYFFSRPLYADRFEAWYHRFSTQCPDKEGDACPTIHKLIRHA